MLHALAALMVAVLLGGLPSTADAHAYTPAPASTNPTSAGHLSHGKSLGRKITLHEKARHGNVGAAACNSRAAAMPGSTGTLGPNGATSSQTLVAVSLGSGTSTSATQQRRIAEACAHARR